MRNLIEYINESRNKDEFYGVKTTSDKYYVVLAKVYHESFIINPATMIDNGWWKPNDRNYDPKVIDDHSWGVCIDLNDDLGRPPKNPLTGKPCAFHVNNHNHGIDYGASLELFYPYEGEDLSETLAAIIDHYIEKYLSKVPSTRKDYKTILKDIRKMLLKEYNDMPEPRYAPGHTLHVPHVRV